MIHLNVYTCISVTYYAWINNLKYIIIIIIKSKSIGKKRSEVCRCMHLLELFRSVCSNSLPVIKGIIQSDSQLRERMRMLIQRFLCYLQLLFFIPLSILISYYCQWVDLSQVDWPKALGFITGATSARWDSPLKLRSRHQKIDAETLAFFF